MDDSSGVAEVDAVDELVQNELDLPRSDGGLVGTQVFFEIVLSVFKHQVELLLHREVNDVPETDLGVKYLTMLGWGWSSLRMEISRMAVEGTPSSSFSSLIFLRATISLVLRSRAR